MRCMLKVTVDTVKANEAIKSGRLGHLIEQTMKQIKAEASYFTTENGKRTMFLFCDMADASMIPPMAEPLFMELNAEISLTPCMNLDELKKGLKEVAGMATAGAR